MCVNLYVCAGMSCFQTDGLGWGAHTHTHTHWCSVLLGGSGTVRGISVVSAESNTHVSTCDGPREAPKQTNSHRIGNMAYTHSFREIQRSQSLERNGRETKDEMRNERVTDSEDEDECVCVCVWR